MPSSLFHEFLCLFYYDVISIPSLTSHTTLKIHLENDFLKTKLIGNQVLLIFREGPSKSLHQIRSFLGPMSNMIKVSLETKMAEEMEI